MPDSLQAWAEAICAGEHRAIARAISAIESRDAAGPALEKLIFRKTGSGYTVGVTGSPGVGKSTLVEKLALEYRRAGVRVGILAVDPTSPFSGGAILGDRIRMQALATDDGAYIRSMATRGRLGGLAAATFDAVAILDAAGCGAILVETVGVGQDEVDVARLADATLVVLAPGMGDDVQTFKAGVMEIADVFVVNKADRPDAARLEQEIAAMQAVAPDPSRTRAPILRAVATTGEGVAGLTTEIERLRLSPESGAMRRERLRTRWRERLLEMARERLFERAWGGLGESGALDAYVEDILARRADPESVIERMMGERKLEDAADGAHAEIRKSDRAE